MKVFLNFRTAMFALAIVKDMLRFSYFPTVQNRDTALPLDSSILRLFPTLKEHEVLVSVSIPTKDIEIAMSIRRRFDVAFLPAGLNIFTLICFSLL